MYEYRAHVTRVIDGDTLEVNVDLGLGVSRKERVRLAGVDTPETWRPKTDAEKAHGKEATAFVMECVLAQDIILNTVKDRQGKYGRYLGYIKYTCGIDKVEKDLATELKAADLVKRDHYSDLDDIG